jgi:hypothetical protein
LATGDEKQNKNEKGEKKKNKKTSPDLLESTYGSLRENFPWIPDDELTAIVSTSYSQLYSMLDASRPTASQVQFRPWP